MFADIPPRLSPYRYLSVGAVGWVYQISNRVVIKYPRDPSDENFKRELEIFDLLEKHELCPDIIQSFLRTPEGNFLEFLSGGTLDQRLRAHQVRIEGRPDGIVARVTKIEPIDLIIQWLVELSNAAAWLESLGLAHNDIRPPNLLLDGGEHLKLADFDSVSKIGEEAEGSPPPWARVLGPEAGEINGTYGLCGPTTEQFAIGSVLYYMTRGYEPYDNENFGERHGRAVVDKLRRMEFPELDNGKLDRVIEKCWKGAFQSIRDLALETKSLDGADRFPRAVVFDTDYRARIREECQSLLDEGLLTRNQVSSG